MPKTRLILFLMWSLALPGCLLSACNPLSLSPDKYDSNRYLTGRGCGKNIEAAKASALSSLSEKMRVSVRSNTHVRKEETELKGTGRHDETLRSKTMQAIDLKSRGTFFNVRFPQEVHTAEGPCLLAIMDKHEAKKRLVSEISHMRSNLSTTLNHLPAGSNLELFHVFVRAKNALSILKSDSETLSDLGNDPGTLRFMDTVQIKMDLLSQHLTFAINARGRKDLYSFVPIDLETVGLQQVRMEDHPAFVVQGEMKMAPIQAPDNSSWFWYGFSGALAIVDTKTMLNVALSSGSGTVSGYTATQAEIHTQRTIEQTIVSPLIQKLLGV